MDVTLVAEKRADKGKNQARRHRVAGRLPAVVYGPGTGGANEQAIPVTVDPKALSKILHSESGANTIISLQLDGGSVPVLVKDFLLQPVTHALLHADFYRVAMDRKLTVTVPVTLTGEAKGVKQQGGVLDFVTREFEIEVLPADIPGEHRGGRHRTAHEPGRAHSRRRAGRQVGRRSASPRRCSCTSCRCASRRRRCH